MSGIFYIFLALFIGCQGDYSVVEKNILEAVSDSFVQASKTGSLDILVVLDTSGSMMDNFVFRLVKSAR